MHEVFIACSCLFLKLPESLGILFSHNVVYIDSKHIRSTFAHRGGNSTYYLISNYNGFNLG